MKVKKVRYLINWLGNVLKPKYKLEAKPCIVFEIVILRYPLLLNPFSVTI